MNVRVLEPELDTAEPMDKGCHHDHVNTWGEVTAAAEGGQLEETPWVELKEMLTPGRLGNRELAKDLAALSVYGGVLVIGVRDKTFEVVGFDASEVSTYVTRISQVATMSIHPPLTPVIYPAIMNPEDGSKAVLVVEVPASAVAPHMADDKYWGRSSEGKRPLSDPEIRALISARENTDSTFRARLLAMPGNDPVNDRVIEAPLVTGTSSYSPNHVRPYLVVTCKQTSHLSSGTRLSTMRLEAFY